MPNIGDLLPHHNIIPSNLKGLTRENAAARLASVTCPLCGGMGQYFIFNKGPHQGVLCLGCGREHVFRRYGIMWLPSADNAWRRLNP